MYKTCAIEKAGVVIGTSPKAKKLEYTGSSQTLVTNAKNVVGGMVYYNLSINNNWSTLVSIAINSGEYNVQYYAKASNPNYKDSSVKDVLSL